ncbi:MAG TPA: hypothetical protein P5016_20950, partial [Verrucomicrobiales bacterium]|nr:hypothetical protein [Verrucomicrobiales bacterium]
RQVWRRPGSASETSVGKTVALDPGSLGVIAVVVVRKYYEYFPHWRRLTDCMKTPKTPTAVLSIARLQRGLDFFRSYWLEIDGVAWAKLQARETIYLPISPGQHTARVRIDWCRSHEITFDAGEGETIQLECSTHSFGWNRLVASFRRLFRPSEYLWLRQTYTFPGTPTPVIEEDRRQAA